MSLHFHYGSCHAGALCVTDPQKKAGVCILFSRNIHESTTNTLTISSLCSQHRALPPRTSSGPPVATGIPSREILFRGRSSHGPQVTPQHASCSGFSPHRPVYRCPIGVGDPARRHWLSITGMASIVTLCYVAGKAAAAKSTSAARDHQGIRATSRPQPVVGWLGSVIQRTK
jgi:hypothetical protein